MPAESIKHSTEIMNRFAQDTGLTGSQPQRRYLWTDAFGVCNFLELYRCTRDPVWLDLARRLVEQVHQVLGRHREDDPRQGWISGLSEEQGALHPCAGGLRIGKPINESPPNETGNSRLDWDRDGQYFHYLTKWMLALQRMASVTDDPAYHQWAVELAQASHEAFVYDVSLPHGHKIKRMYWKMSIDLSRPMVQSMGQHDPLDGYITFLELQTSETDVALNRTVLGEAIEDLSGMCQSGRWKTDDPLGLGGILSDSLRLGQLVVAGTRPQISLLDTLLKDAFTSLKSLAKESLLRQPALYRLAFRELGLAIGIHALEQLSVLVSENLSCFDNIDVEEKLADLADHVPLANVIENFWLTDSHREVSSWTEHRDINSVMLVTSLMPNTYLNSHGQKLSRH